MHGTDPGRERVRLQRRRRSRLDDVIYRGAGIVCERENKRDKDFKQIRVFVEIRAGSCGGGEVSLLILERDRGCGRCYFCFRFRLIKLRVFSHKILKNYSGFYFSEVVGLEAR